MTEPPAPDFSQCARKNSERLAIVEFVLGSSVLEEADYLEWKSGYDLSKRPGAASTAKQLIGMANRDFAHANRHAEGHAYVLLGVEPGNLPGVPHWDAADLENWLSRFVQAELRYDEHYVEIDGKEVLVLTIAPPRQGDPIFCLQQSSQDVENEKTLPKGTIYVRHGGKTEPPTPEDISRLSARLLVAEATSPDLSLELDARKVKVIDPNLVSGSFRDERLRSWRAGMLARLPKRETGYAALTQFAIRPLDETRTEEAYKAEVELYVQTIKGTSNAWLRIMATEWVKAKRSELGVRVKNNTDENYENVVVEVTFFGVGRANMYLWPGEAEGVLRPPEEPFKWGESFAARIARGTQPVAAAHLRSPEPEIEEVGAGQVFVRYPELRVRPHTTHRLAPILLALPPFMAGTIIKTHWRATASNAKSHQEGDLELLVPGEHETVVT